MCDQDVVYTPYERFHTPVGPCSAQRRPCSRRITPPTLEKAAPVGEHGWEKPRMPPSCHTSPHKGLPFHCHPPQADSRLNLARLKHTAPRGARPPRTGRGESSIAGML
jgi:hypothetical protein